MKERGSTLIWILIISIVILFATAGIWIYLFDNNNGPYLNECEDIADEDLKQNCYYEYADRIIQSNNTKNCKYLKIKWMADECIVKIAKKTNDLSQCNEATGTLRDSCIGSFAIKNSDSSLCKKLKTIEIRDNCYLGIMKKTLDKNLCNEISEEETFEKYNAKDRCFNYVGQISKNIEICKNILNIDLRDACTYNTLIEIGDYGKSDIELCNNLQKIESKKDCQRWSLGLMTNFQAESRINNEGHINGCAYRELKLIEIEKDKCIYNSVKNTFEPKSSLCSGIIDQTIKEQCLNLVANWKI